jgi:hypothetical protein
MLRYAVPPYPPAAPAFPSALNITVMLMTVRYLHAVSSSDQIHMFVSYTVAVTSVICASANSYVTTQTLNDDMRR